MYSTVKGPADQQAEQEPVINSNEHRGVRVAVKASSHEGGQSSHQKCCCGFYDGPTS
jgi:hypothetical protein